MGAGRPSTQIPVVTPGSSTAAVPGPPRSPPAAGAGLRAGALLLHGPLHSLGCWEGLKLEVFIGDNVQNSPVFLDRSQYSQAKLRRKHLPVISGHGSCQERWACRRNSLCLSWSFQWETAFSPEELWGEQSPSSMPKKSPNSNCSWSFSVQNYFSLV